MVLAAAMVLGVVGVLASFDPLGGLIAASVLLYALVSAQPAAEPMGSDGAAAGRGASPTGLLIAATVGLHGLGRLARAHGAPGAAAAGHRWPQ